MKSDVLLETKLEQQVLPGKQTQKMAVKIKRMTSTAAVGSILKERVPALDFSAGVPLGDKPGQRGGVYRLRGHSIFFHKTMLQ